VLLINALLLIVLTVSALSDALHGKIYNLVTYPATIVGVVLNAAGVGGVGGQASLIGWAVGFLPFLGLFALGLMNGGDVKLLGAIGALKGYPFILHAIFLSFLVAAFLALATLVWRGRVFATVRHVIGVLMNSPVSEQAADNPPEKAVVPFGIAAWVGTGWALLMVELC
jgi:prepilin peptidase CpaA